MIGKSALAALLLLPASPAWAQNATEPPPVPATPPTGTVGFRLSVDESGAPTKCTITRSSGHPELDRKSCDTLMAKARFKPKIDKNGKAVKAEYSSSIVFKIED